MKRSPLALSGKQFGSITVTGKASKARYWLGACECSPTVQREFNGSRLASGKLTHCGCQRAKHGHTTGKTRSPTYVSSQDMRERCKNSSGTRNHDPRWSTFQAFLEDMAERPSGTTLDRINPLGGYNKANCRWATRQTQDFNKTNTRIYCVDPVRQNLCGSALEWAEFFTRSTGTKMTVPEFEIIMKFLTPEQLWCSQHPFCTLEKLKESVQEEKRKNEADETTRKIEAERVRRQRQQTEQDEDAGYVPEDDDGDSIP